MTATASTRAIRPPDDQPTLVAWHGGWAVATSLLALGSSVLGARAEGPLAFAMIAMILPGLAGLALKARDGLAQRGLLLGFWSLMAVAASALSGGLTGSLTGFVFMPVAAGLMLGGKRFAQAGALGCALATIVGLVSLIMAGTGPVFPGLAAVSAVLTAGATAIAVSTAWRQRDLKVAEADARTRRTLDVLKSQPALTLVLDPSGNVTTAYGKAPTALPVAALLSDGLVAAVHAPDRPELLSAIEKTLTFGTRNLTITPRLALDRRIDLTLRRVDDSEGRVRILGLAIDATARHARELGLEAARAEAEAQNAGKSRFLANMSHELRTPLNAVIGFSDIMRQRIFGPLPDRYADYATSIHEAGGHLLDLINDVLDVSKIEAERYELALERFDARDVISAAIALVRLQANEKGVALSGMMPGGPLIIHADRRALKQITLNLLSNAIKFTQGGGSVTVTLEAQDGLLELIVADTGVGIAAEDLRRLGRPFEQAGGTDQRSQGTGLGLSLVRALAELHGGRMTIDSTLGEGAAVTLRLPVLATVPAPPPEGGAEIIPLHARTDV